MILSALKQYFGYDSFRPLQREIVEASLRGEDVLALLPTGGGKSLCYQLPALLHGGLTLVISPLIALMKDQTDALAANGVPATFLNSSLDAATAARRVEGLDRGEYRLLYVAPERLAMPGFTVGLKRWNVARFAVDEAHCVSEWGHDFRPEYRRIALLREQYPQLPILALTATATEHVRKDIEHYLALKTPQLFIASFDRPNIRYHVIEKHDPFKQLLAFASARSTESGIVYVQSRNGAEDLATRLTEAGITALPYHAGLTPSQRSRNQELFIRDEIRVICATIAFGMGIDKPNVRYVAHYDLPKNLEGYYQESGRAGRDGLPSDCVLFFSGGDAAKQRRFIGEIADERERRAAEARLRQMVEYGATAHCRRRYLLSYFGESPREGCGNCDNCLTPRERIDGTLAASKMLSCIYRIRQHSGFSTGAHHVIDVLLGTATEKVTARGHDRLSTFGIGADVAKNEWLAIASELLRVGYVEHDSVHRTLTITSEGLEALKQRRSVEYFKPMTAGKAKKRRRDGSGREMPLQERLFETLRALRKRIADEQGVPPYVVFSDATLRELCTNKPVTTAAFREIGGVGDVKLQRYGEVFVEAIRADADLERM